MLSPPASDDSKRWSSRPVCRERWHRVVASTRSTCWAPSGCCGPSNRWSGPGRWRCALRPSRAIASPEAPALMTVLEDPLSEGFFERLRDVGVDPDNAPLGYSVSKTRCHATRQARSQALGHPRCSDPVPLTKQHRHRDEPDAGTADADPGRDHQEQPARAARRGRKRWRSVVSFLACERASFMTGCDVLVDGGMATTMPSTSGEGARVVAFAGDGRHVPRARRSCERGSWTSRRRRESNELSGVIA